MTKLKRRVHEIFQPTPVRRGRIVAARRRDVSTAYARTLLLDSVDLAARSVVILASYSDVYQRYHYLFNAVFAFAIVVLPLELLLVCGLHGGPAFRGPIKGRLKCFLQHPCS